jgi:anti-sigma regulatory factor (Ser/Thr protein kinase)
VTIQQAVNRLTIQPYPGAVPRSGAAPSQDHAVLFYDDPAHAADRLADYAAEGLAAGQAVVAVLTPPHVDALVVTLRVRGLEPEVARADGRLVLLDAASTLQTFLVDGAPDRSLLAAGVGALVGGLVSSGRKVRAAGEMVALVWADGNVAGALALESAWNELADEMGFALLCPYPSSVLETGDLDQVGRLCALHSEVLAPEGYASGLTFAGSAAHLTTEVFVPAPEAVGAARRMVAGAIADWSTTRGERPDDLLVADACLVASEMAANAVTHAGSAFEVTVTCAEGVVRITVSDSGPGAAECHAVEPLEVGGRGLAIVSDVADRWGSDAVPGGKVVWAELAVRQPVAP